MEDLDQGDEQTFNINFSADGVAKLRERVTDKLQEFMGDYTDDTLVEYVIVLLKNGRHKEEAKNELNVFLGSDSDSFVSWLWDHLSTNLHLYAQVPESYLDETTKGIPLVGVEAGREPQQLDVESEREKSTKGSKSRRNREWKGLVSDATDTPPLRSSEIEIFHPEERNHKKYSRAKRSHSPRPVQRKRNRQDDRYEPKKEVPSHPTIAPPSRILQFAMRDAVGTIRSSSLKTEPTSKRLRSVVSTSTGDLSLENQPSRIRSVARVSSAMTSAINAAAAAAEDVTKLRGSVNVFDRLGHGLHVSEITTQSPCFKRSMIEGAEHEDFDRMEQVVHPDYLRRNEDSTENMMLDRHVAIAYDSNSDNEYDDGISVGDNRKMDASLSGWTSGYRNDKGSYSTTKNTNDVMRTQVKDQGPPSSMANNSRKILNISVNVNTWKPPQYQVSGDSKVENLKAVHESKVSTGKLDGRLVKEKSNTVMDTKENEKFGSDTQKKTQSILPSNNGSNSASRSSDADSGTIFVSNVHFAATKDSLSRHFNKFGEVLKVVIVTDAATGLPKGSAYIEFLRKEAAELALSLNGTSFMSRILKVVKKSSSSQEVNPVMTWPHTARGSPFPGRGTRVAFPRGQPMFRTRQPIKSGPRSLQWKRGSPAAPAVEGSNSQNGASLVVNNVQSPSPRSLTYVRTAAKPM